MFNPEDYRRLERVARVKHVSVAELIRTAVEEKYLATREERIQAVEALSKMRAPVGKPEQIELETERARFK